MAHKGSRWTEQQLAQFQESRATKQAQLNKGMKEKPSANETEKPKWFIGIDPGTDTGVAVWSRTQRKFTFVHTYTIFEALKFVESFIDSAHADGGVMVIFEDARKRKSLPKQADGAIDKDRLQGAGSVKRDSAIWQEACEQCAKRWKIGFTWRGVAPNGKTNALAADKDLSSRNLGITYNTSEHARCAAFLVWKM
jgi:hypothetical protein